MSLQPTARAPKTFDSQSAPESHFINQSPLTIESLSLSLSLSFSLSLFPSISLSLNLSLSTHIQQTTQTERFGTNRFKFGRKQPGLVPCAHGDHLCNNPVVEWNAKFDHRFPPLESFTVWLLRKLVISSSSPFPKSSLSPPPPIPAWCTAARLNLI